MIKTAAQILAEIAASEIEEKEDVLQAKRGRPRVKSPVCVEDGCEGVSAAWERCSRHKSKFQNSGQWKPIPPCDEPGCARTRIHKLKHDNRRTWHRSKERYVTIGEPLMVWRTGEKPVQVGRRTQGKCRNVAMKTRLEVMRRLVMARKDRGLTQWDVAFRMGRTQSLISDMERGVTGLNMNNLQSYAKAIDLMLTAGYDLVKRGDR